MEHEEIFEQFIGQAIITDLRGQVKSGKEAVVYRCGAHPSTGLGEVAVKVYKDIENRSFRKMNSYLDGRIGRTIRKRRDILHMFSTPSSMQAFWVETEFNALEILHSAGIAVPRPLGFSGSSIAMEFIAASAPEGADCPAAAPRLRDLRFGPAEAEDMRRALLSAIEGMLSLDMVHGDLSPYNVLVRDRKPVIIDFPQAADARFSTQARSMFDRDVANVLGFFKDEGPRVKMNPAMVASDLWNRYESGELYRARDAVALAREWGLEGAV